MHRELSCMWHIVHCAALAKGTAKNGISLVSIYIPWALGAENNIIRWVKRAPSAINPAIASSMGVPPALVC